MDNLNLDRSSGLLSTRPPARRRHQPLPVHCHFRVPLHRGRARVQLRGTPLPLLGVRRRRRPFQPAPLLRLATTAVAPLLQLVLVYAASLHRSLVCATRLPSDFALVRPAACVLNLVCLPAPFPWPTHSRSQHLAAAVNPCVQPKATCTGQSAGWNRSLLAPLGLGPLL